MTSMTDPFLQMSELAADPPAMIATLVKVYRQQQMPHELFEALKMQMRLQLGLPVLPDDSAPPQPEDIERQLESGLLAACREVGAMLMRAGRVRDGWTYLRPTGDIRAAAELINQVPVREDNADEIISVCLHEAVDVGHGFKLLLERMGTCNSITTFDQVLTNRHYREQRIAAALLLEHVYGELRHSLIADIRRRQEEKGAASADPAPVGDDQPIDQLPVDQLIANRPELLAGGAYHLDTTHLASTIRICRVLEEQSQLEKISHLIAYGRKLHSQYQYPGEEPFVDFYPANGLFIDALLGRGVDQAIRYFRDKANQVDPLEHGTRAVEVYIDLLDRLGRPHDALQAALDLIPADIPVTRVAPLLLELAQKAGNYQPVLDFARRRGDLLMFAAALSEAANIESTPAS